jgi:hypothetical protein
LAQFITTYACCFECAHSDDVLEVRSSRDAVRKLPEPNEHSNNTQERQIQSSFLDRGSGASFTAGTYEIVTDAELIEGLSFPVYRRVATMILAPTQSFQGSIVMLTIDPSDLAAAMKRDAFFGKGVSVSAKPP